MIQSHPLLTSWRVAVVVAAMIVLSATPRDASGHAELLRADPPIDGLIAVPPRDLDLWFSEDIATTASSPSVRLFDQEGRDLSVEEVTVDPTDPKHVTADLGSVLPGTVTVVWSVLSATDGHTLTGTYAFRVGTGTAPGAATTEGETPRAWAVATRWLTFLGVALAAAGFAMSLGIIRPGEESAVSARRRMILTLAGLVVALLATVAEPLLQTRWPPAGSSSPSLAEAISGLPDAWWLRPIALIPASLIAARVLVAPQRSSRPRTFAWIGLILALTSLLGLSLTSHASARDSWRLLAVTSNTMHQWCVALWVGGLAQLAIWWSTQRGPDMPGQPVRRFSRAALVLVLVGVGAGVVNAGFVLPAVRSLWTSAYGTVLLLKVGLLTAPLALATYNRRALKRALDSLRPAVRQAVRVEAVLVLLVVLGGSTLALLAPPAAEAELPAWADIPAPALAAYKSQDLLVHLNFTPGEAGENSFVIRLSNYDRSPFTGAQPARVKVRFDALEAPVEIAPIDAQLSSDNGWAVSGRQLSLAGWWRLEVILRWLGQPDVAVPFYLLLPDPNLNGLDAPKTMETAERAAQLYASAMAAYTGMHRVRYVQVTSSHTGSGAITENRVNDGSDGSTPGFTYSAVGGWEAVVLGTTSWTKLPGEDWETGEVNPMIPPAEWDDEYVGATGFRLGRVENLNGEDCQILTFVVPGTRKQTAAWYAWWVGVESGQVRRMVMISRSHYMTTQFSDFDAPMEIKPPSEFAA